MTSFYNNSLLSHSSQPVETTKLQTILAYIGDNVSHFFPQPSQFWHTKANHLRRMSELRGLWKKCATLSTRPATKMGRKAMKAIHDM
jgi:hypothetical protein